MQEAETKISQLIEFIHSELSSLINSRKLVQSSNDPVKIIGVKEGSFAFQKLPGDKLPVSLIHEVAQDVLSSSWNLQFDSILTPDNLTYKEARASFKELVEELDNEVTSEYLWKVFLETIRQEILMSLNNLSFQTKEYLEEIFREYLEGTNELFFSGRYKEVNHKFKVDFITHFMSIFHEKGEYLPMLFWFSHALSDLYLRREPTDLRGILVSNEEYLRRIAEICNLEWFSMKEKLIEKSKILLNSTQPNWSSLWEVKVWFQGLNVTESSWEHDFSSAKYQCKGSLRQPTPNDFTNQITRGNLHESLCWSETLITPHITALQGKYSQYRCYPLLNDLEKITKGHEIVGEVKYPTSSIFEGTIQGGRDTVLKRVDVLAKLLSLLTVGCVRWNRVEIKYMGLSTKLDTALAFVSGDKALPYKTGSVEEISKRQVDLNRCFRALHSTDDSVLNRALRYFESALFLPESSHSAHRVAELVHCLEALLVNDEREISKVFSESCEKLMRSSTLSPPSRKIFGKSRYSKIGRILYDIRSRYVHGGEMINYTEKEWDDLLVFSFELARTALIRFQKDTKYAPFYDKNKWIKNL